MTLKKALLRGLIGIPLMVTLSYAITIITSLFWGGGPYSPAIPAFVDAVGTESGAVALQFLLTALMGFEFAAATAVWEIERWNLAAQTVCHFALISLGTFPVAWICHWAEYIPGGLLGYFGIFAAIYLVIWLSITAAVRRKVRAVNQKLQNR